MKMARISFCRVFLGFCVLLTLQTTPCLGDEFDDDYDEENSGGGSVDSRLDRDGNPYRSCVMNIPWLNVSGTSSSKLQHTFQIAYRMDTALLNIITDGREYVYMWQHGDCYKCPLFQSLLSVTLFNCSQRMQTKYPNVIRVETLDGTDSCEMRRRFTDKGLYQLSIRTISNALSCDITPLNKPPNPDLPLLYAFLVYFGLAAIYVTLNFLYRRGTFDRLLSRFNLRPTKIGDITPSSPIKHSAQIEENMPNGIGKENGGMENMSNGIGKENGGIATPPPPATEPVPSQPPTTEKRKRLQSLDAFRGLSLVIMMFVNYGSAGYWYIDHAIWNGLTVGDLVFPWFIFMMGTSMAFSFRGMFRRNTKNYVIVWKIVWRSAQLFLLGLFLGGNNNVHTIRIPGVLQRFSATYLVTALVFFPSAKMATKKKKSLLGDIINYWPEWIIMLGLLALHLALTFALEVPGCPTGYLGPGGLAENASYYYDECSGGAAGYIDLKVLGPNHTYRWPTIQSVYRTNVATLGYFEPEGILGTPTSIFLCFLGLQAGKIIDMHKDHVQVLSRWAVWGVVTGGIALLLSNCNQDDGWIPINKNLWSVSFIMAMASTAFFGLGIMYVIIDLLDIWNGAPFIFPGMNSIAVYFLHSSYWSNFPVNWAMPDEQEHWQRLIVVCWSTSFWTFIAYVLYFKKIFIAL